MAKWHPVNPDYIKECHRCGAPITFVKDKRGRTRLAALYHRPGWGLVRVSGLGTDMVGGSTSWHQCPYAVKKDVKEVSLGKIGVEDKKNLQKFRDEIMAKYNELLAECLDDLIKYKEILNQYLCELNGDEVANS